MRSTVVPAMPPAKRADVKAGLAGDDEDDMAGGWLRGREGRGGRYGFLEEIAGRPPRAQHFGRDWTP